jgi:hypothetical protein
MNDVTTIGVGLNLGACLLKTPVLWALGLTSTLVKATLPLSTVSSHRQKKYIYNLETLWTFFYLFLLMCGRFI